MGIVALSHTKKICEDNILARRCHYFNIMLMNEWKGVELAKETNKLGREGTTRFLTLWIHMRNLDSKQEPYARISSFYTSFQHLFPEIHDPSIYLHLTLLKLIPTRLPWPICYIVLIYLFDTFMYFYCNYQVIFYVSM